MKKIATYYLPIFVLTAFALLTLFLSSSVILDLFGIRAKEGNYVMFVVVANFMASILYLAAAYNWYKLRDWAYKLLGSSALILIVAQMALYFHISGGGIYEEKTVKAMFFRIGLTIFFAVVAYYFTRKTRLESN